tara:strand:+ start:3533 stop:3901 length:369 start_codon:yes stop_codon:yes gene_type:complete
MNKWIDMKKLNLPLISKTFISMLLLVLSFVSFGSALEITSLKNQNNIQISVPTDANVLDIFHEKHNSIKHCDFKNCHSGNHCGIVQTELSMLPFEHNQLLFAYDSFLMSIYLDVPLHPPRYF